MNAAQVNSEVTGNEVVNEAQAAAKVLGKYAKDIKKELTAVAAFFRKSLDHARTVGQLLSEAKTYVQHGRWVAWLDENFNMKPRTSQRYMSLFERWDEIKILADERGIAVADLTIVGAIHLLSKKKDEELVPQEDVELVPDVEDEIVRQGGDGELVPEDIASLPEGDNHILQDRLDALFGSLDAEVTEAVDLTRKAAPDRRQAAITKLIELRAKLDAAIAEASV